MEARAGREALSRGAAPASYRELFEEYHGMVLSLAAKVGIRPEDCEDAAAEVELRFWKKDGLSWYDPDLEHEPPEGGWRDGHVATPRRARFGGMYRRWAYLNMLQERDRHGNRLARVQPATDEALEARCAVAQDPAEAMCSAESLREWGGAAARLLVDLDRIDLLPTLEATLESALRGEPTQSRVELGLAVGVSPARAAQQVQTMSELLRTHGMGPESLAS